MTSKELTAPVRELRVFDTGALVAHFRWSDGEVTVVTVSPELAEASLIWLATGISTWGCSGGEAHPLSVPSSDPEFLSALQVYIAQQTELDVRLTVHGKDECQ